MFSRLLRTSSEDFVVGIQVMKAARKSKRRAGAAHVASRFEQRRRMSLCPPSFTPTSFRVPTPRCRGESESEPFFLLLVPSFTMLMDSLAVFACDRSLGLPPPLRFLPSQAQGHRADRRAGGRGG
eukprot:754752-Hanusia_phi.AAC.2